MFLQSQPEMNAKKITILGFSFPDIDMSIDSAVEENFFKSNWTIITTLLHQCYSIISQKEFKKKISLNLIHVMVCDNNIINLRYLRSCVLHLIATIQKGWFDRFLVIICWGDLKWFKTVWQ